MPEKLTVLFLPHPVDPSMFQPWGEDVVAAIGDHHNLRILDYNQSIASQFEGVDVVIDHGGAAGTREMADIAAGKVCLWQILGTGIDHFDMDYWRSKEIPVANCPGPFSAVPLAECAMMFILMLARRYPITQANLKAGEMYKPMGLELEGLKLSIVGFGASGKELARRALPFGMRILAIDIRDVGADEVREFGLKFVGKPEDLDQVLAESDVVSLHLHLNDETRHTINARRLRLMKPTALLINVARGALVD
ncbi:MAG: hypothetical protein OXT74_02935, partial [Candidatus Poribacteria bacterium]|nr:hypothetical protein [Candidatus Poribacteria bacterium]